MSHESDDAHLVWENLDSEVQYDAGIFKLHSVRRRSPAGRHAPFVSLESPDWVTIIPEFEDPETGSLSFLIVRQYRHGTERVGLEFPAGAVDPGELPAVAAARELLEETGYQADVLLEIGAVSPNPAFMTNTAYTFVARGLKKISDQKLDEHEILDVHQVPLEMLEDAIGLEPYDSAITVQAWFFYLRAQG